MTWAEARWGLLLIAAEGYYRNLAEQRQNEDAAMQATRRALGG